MATQETGETRICNLALSEAGHKQPIQSINSSGAAAVQCKLWYAKCRDTVLALYPWDFATQWITLALNPDEDLNSEFGYVYQKPSACIRVHGLFSDADYRVREQMIYTNDSAAVARYTKRITDPTKFSEWFTDVLVTLLASRLAGHFGRKEKQKELKNDFKRMRLTAESLQRNQNKQRTPAKPQSSWLLARR